MREFLQGGLFRAYRAAVDAGFLKTAVGVRLYESAYSLYKGRLEAPWAGLLRPFVPAGSTAVDVGANIGFFTRRFARWVGPEGRVVAIEPEPANFERLRRRLESSGLGKVVLLHLAAAAEREGEAFLSLNPYHPGDHRLGESGLPVRTVTLDALLARADLPPVSLIKIDVQGAEAKVIEGARKLLTERRPALCVEVDDSALRQQGSSCAELLGKLRAFGYRIRRLEPRSISEPISEEEAVRAASRPGTYGDYLFVP